jgi:exodeoxyribonuclease V gamma subunit
MLHLHRAERADRLADALASILASPAVDPFAREVVAVATRGQERWLTQTLAARLGASPSHRDGVCAGIEFPFPGRLIGDAVALASGIDPHADPWRPERMVWPLEQAIAEAEGQGRLAELHRHLASAPERRFARVRRLAALFDAYALRRPDLIREWAQEGGAEHGWQPLLWRAVRERIGIPSGPERLREACARLREEPELLELPERLSLFGLTRLPASQVEVLAALAHRREVHLLLLHPSPALWEALACAPSGGSPLRLEDDSADRAVNRLLASWGRDSRELQLVLRAGLPDELVRHHHHPLLPHRGSERATHRGAERTPHPGAERATHGGADASRPEPRQSLLAALQADVRANRAPPGPPLPGEQDRRLALLEGDDSVQVHACHGRRRQVEVLREAILHRMARDPSLEPREVIVMCPDVEVFEPLVQGAFGTGAIPLQVRVADRAPRRANPLLGVLARLLELPPSRVTCSQVLDLAAAEPVRRRFLLDDGDLARIEDWVANAGVHWGLDAAHRQRFAMGRIEAGTWAFGLRRIALGVALSGSPANLYGGVLPVDDVGSTDIDLAGRLCELVRRLEHATSSLTGPHTVRGWTAALQRAADALCASDDAEAWQRAELTRLLAELIEEAGPQAGLLQLRLPEIRELLGSRLQGRPTRANFRTGHLTLCTLHPMRSVPHRVVCLLGLDDGAFPRRSARDGDDLLLAEPHLGDRDPRSEDRQLLLDALLSTRETLIVTYTGADERTNAQRPPAVPVGELLEAVEATAVAGDGGSAIGQVLVRHPLQPFDPRNFRHGVLCRDGAWSYDRVSLEGARALEGPRADPPRFLDGPLPPAPEERTLALADLVRFVERPVRAFLRQRLGILVAQDEGDPEDRLPIELDGLERWGIGERMLESLIAGVDPADCWHAEMARGTLPPGALGKPLMEHAWNEAKSILSQARAYGGSSEPRSLETNLRLPDGVRINGTVSGVREPVLLSVSYSRLRAQDRLGAWVRLLALTAAHPEAGWEAVTVGRAVSVGRGERRGSAAVARIPPLGASTQVRRQQALTELSRLVELRRMGMREPLPLPSSTAAAYATAVHRGLDGAAAAQHQWETAWRSGRRREGEDNEEEHLRAFGRQLTLRELLSERAGSAESGPGWREAESSRFGRLALRLWGPLLDREELSEA